MNNLWKKLVFMIIKNNNKLKIVKEIVKINQYQYKIKVWIESLIGDRIKKAATIENESVYIIIGTLLKIDNWGIILIYFYIFHFFIRIIHL